MPRTLRAVTPGDIPISDLKAVCRHGQVFLTWREADTPAGAFFNVYASEQPIRTATLSQARKIAHHIEAHSARDWWEDPASFKKGEKPSAPVGFLIEVGGNRLDPSGGLFVDTVGAAPVARLYYAVTCTWPGGKEDTRIQPGKNALMSPVSLKPGSPAPIWQRNMAPPAPGAGKGKPLALSLHAKGGVVADMNYLVFGDETLGWRKGLPFKFAVRVTEKEVVVAPTDRVWINRPLKEAADSGVPAIWTFWYGYNSNIYDRDAMAQGVPTNYTERRLLWILKWVQEHYQTDRNHAYIWGSSMGGCGSISFGLRHPEMFAALHAHVPIVSYTYLGRASASRLEPFCWVGKITDEVKTDEGIFLLDRMNGTKLVKEAKADLPFVYIIVGRRDASIPWQNNPPFLRALNEARQGFCAYWDNGEHATCGKDAPADVKAWQQRFRGFRLDESYPAFSNCSDNKNPGNGDPQDGDIIGWMNRGLDWKDLRDTAQEYALTVTADYPGIKYPLTVDVTPRRVQRFKVRSGEKVKVVVAGEGVRTLVADENGLLTVRGVKILGPQGTQLRITR